MECVGLMPMSRVHSLQSSSSLLPQPLTSKLRANINCRLLPVSCHPKLTVRSCLKNCSSSKAFVNESPTIEDENPSPNRFRIAALANVSVPDLNKDPPPGEEEEPQSSHLSGFEWKSHWYAVGVAQDLDPTRPHGMMLLGRHIVLWKDPILQGEIDQGKVDQTQTAWRCFLDRCPHRLVPLSEGRIDEKGLLQCSYHGWTFGGDGKCQGIPQAAKNGPEKNAFCSPNACATSFPILEEQGILFVWPDESPQGKIRASATRLPMPAGIEHGTWKLGAYARDLNYGYDMLAENVMDPSHLPFSHHGVGSLNRSLGQAYPHASIISEREGVQGFVGRLFEPTFPCFSPVQFRAPSLFAYYRSTGIRSKEPMSAEALGSVREMKYEELESGECGGVFLTALFITPVAPGKSKIVTLQGSKVVADPPKRSLLSTLLSNRWISHLFMNQVLDGDAYFLHAQEKVVQEVMTEFEKRADSQAPTNGSAAKGSNGAAKAQPASLVSSAYFLPTVADRFVIGFRKWLDRYAGGAVEFPEEFASATLSPDWTPKREILDRYSTHTSQCTTCQKALKNFQTAQRAMFAGSVAMVFLSVHLEGWGETGCLLGGVVLGVAGVLLQKMIDLFIYTGYDHASK